LNDEGRVMVLRALLLRHERELKLFRQSARRPGFAQELSRLLGELQQHQFTPAKLRALARPRIARELQDKLHDLALLGEAYAHWLAGHELQDANHLLDFATDALRQNPRTPDARLRIQISGLVARWFCRNDAAGTGFARRPPAALRSPTLAFCLETPLETGAETSWLSIWSSVGKTFQQCRQRLENCRMPNQKLNGSNAPPKKPLHAKNSELRSKKLEEKWARPQPHPASHRPPSAISIFACANPEAEAVFAAREILKFVRRGGRFRDCAVMVRNLDGYHKPLARVFRRYGIPFFLDRRESVAHHPLAELTRSALRTVAFDWPHDDWFAALKAGFSP
jgi:ATP-dependent helicase/nuclease subunit B